MLRRDKAVCEYNGEVQAGAPYTLTSEQKESRKGRVKKLVAYCMTARGWKLEEIPIEP